MIDIDLYLKRIQYTGSLRPCFSVLKELHKRHVFSVPFENLDVQHNVRINLNIEHLFQKVVLSRRGGFCYELNYLFCKLLAELGFDVKLISARVYDEEDPGPEFDHMAVLILLDGRFLLADVGFGDLFVTPVEVEESQVQHDGRNYFKIEETTGDSKLLLMSDEGHDFKAKYSFTLTERRIPDFLDQCVWKQLSPDSYFVKNTLITIPTEKGRKTIFNGKFVRKDVDRRSDILISDERHLAEILKTDFGIIL